MDPNTVWEGTWIHRVWKHHCQQLNHHVLGEAISLHQDTREPLLSLVEPGRLEALREAAICADGDGDENWEKIGHKRRV
jgi:hypothetical protein